MDPFGPAAKTVPSEEKLTALKPGPTLFHDFPPSREMSDPEVPVAIHNLCFFT